MTEQPFQDLPVSVYWIWALTFAEATLIVLPMTLYFLRRVLKTARHLQRDMKEMAEAAARITQYSSSLNTSIESLNLTALVQLADSLQKLPLPVGSISTGSAHPGNGKNSGGIL